MDTDQTGARSLRAGDERITAGLLFGMVLCSYVSIAIMQILLGLAFVNWVTGVRRDGRAGIRGPLTLWMCGFVIVSLVSALAVRDAYGAKEALSGGMLMLVYWMALNVLSSSERVGRAVIFVVAGGVIASILGLAQAAFEDRGFRVSGSLSHYMTFSGVLMMAGAVALAMLTFAATNKQRLWWAAALLPILAALLLTQTRGAWVGLAMAASVVLGVRKARLLPLLPLAAVVLYFASPDHVQSRILSTVDVADSTANQRFLMWGVGADMIADHPFLGVGPRRSGVNYDQYRPADDPYRGEPTPGHLHNNVVEIGATRGLLGLLLWLALWILWFFRAGKLCSSLQPEERRAKAVVVGSLAAMTAFQSMGMFEYNVGDSEVATLALFIMALPLAVEGARSAELATRVAT